MNATIKQTRWVITKDETNRRGETVRWYWTIAEDGDQLYRYWTPCPSQAAAYHNPQEAEAQRMHFPEAFVGTVRAVER